MILTASDLRQVEAVKRARMRSAPARLSAEQRGTILRSIIERTGITPAGLEREMGTGRGIADRWVRGVSEVPSHLERDLIALHERVNRGVTA